MIKYGLLDDFGDVIRWVWERPAGRDYIAVKVPRPRIDLSKFGEALL